MFSNILKYLKYGNQFCGIEHYSNNGKNILQVCLLKQSKNELHIESVFQDETIEDTCQKLPKNQNIALVINTDKVLTKTIESEQNDTFKIVYMAFPNINLDDFYFEVLSEKHTHFISLCRRDYIDSIIENYLKQNMFVIAITLGNNSISTVKSFFTADQIQTSNAIINVTDNTIKQIDKEHPNPNIYNINGLEISNKQILSFSGALQSVLNNSGTKTNFEEKTIALTNDFKHARFFNQFLKLGGLFILVLLLANFFLFNHYFKKVSELNQVSEINQSTKTQIVNLNETVSKKQKMVEDLLKSNGSKSSFYSNNILHSLPESILLSELNYQPLIKRIKIDKKVELNEKTISISGNSNDSKAFTNWINVLEKEDWIEKVDIIDYGKAAYNTSDFELKLVLTDD